MCIASWRMFTPHLGASARAPPLVRRPSDLSANSAAIDKNASKLDGEALRSFFISLPIALRGRTMLASPLNEGGSHDKSETTRPRRLSHGHSASDLRQH